MNKYGKHRTSLYIDTRVLDNIMEISDNFNIDIAVIAKDLIKLSIKKAYSFDGIKLAEYQNHESPGWDRLYYYLDDDEVDLFASARKELKFSVSKLLFVGFLLYLKDLIFRYEYRLKIRFYKTKLHNYAVFCEIFKYYLLVLKKRFRIIQNE